LLTLFVAACTVGAPGPGLSAKVYAVKFVPQGNTGVLKADTPNQGCQKSPHNGCLLFSENTVGLLKFYLPDSRSQARSCATGARNVITRVELSATGSGEKGDFSDLPLPEWLQKEAFSGVDLDSGVLYSASIDQGLSQIWLLNANANDSAAGVRTFWYRVTAQNCTTPANTWVSDPRGENTGSRR
jgi:hypothetical protein